jgi:superoxide reductase
MKERFYICRHCGNLIGLIHDAGVPIMCCGEKMEALVPNTADAAGEKHLPVVKTDGNSVIVNVGKAAHPMLEEHYIEWVYVETTSGGMRRAFKPGDDPKVTFCTGEDKPVAVYAYCNLHGLWKTEL